MLQITRNFLACSAGLACVAFSGNAWASEWSYTVTTDSRGKVSVSGPRGGSGTGVIVRQGRSHGIGYKVVLKLPTGRSVDMISYVYATGNPTVTLDDNGDHRNITEKQRGIPLPNKVEIGKIQYNTSENEVVVHVNFSHPNNRQKQAVKKFTIKQPFSAIVPRIAL